MIKINEGQDYDQNSYSYYNTLYKSAKRSIETIANLINKEVRNYGSDANKSPSNNYSKGIERLSAKHDAYDEILRIIMKNDIG